MPRALIQAFSALWMEDSGTSLDVTEAFDRRLSRSLPFIYLTHFVINYTLFVSGFPSLAKLLLWAANSKWHRFTYSSTELFNHTYSIPLGPKNLYPLSI